MVHSNGLSTDWPDFSVLNLLLVCCHRFYSSPYSISTNRMIAQTSITPFIAASPVSTYQVGGIPSNLDSVLSGQCFRVWEVKPMWKCLKPAFFIAASRGGLHWLQKEVWLYSSLWENDPGSQNVMVPITLIPPSTQLDVHLINYGPI